MTAADGQAMTLVAVSWWEMRYVCTYVPACNVRACVREVCFVLCMYILYVHTWVHLCTTYIPNMEHYSMPHPLILFPRPLDPSATPP